MPIGDLIAFLALYWDFSVPAFVTSPIPCKGGSSIISLAGHMKLIVFYSSLKPLVIESFWLA